MTLSASNLKSLILAATGNPGDFAASPAEATQRLTDAYDTYAQDAVDGSGDGPLVVNKSGFQSALNFTGTTSSAAATSFEAAVVAYWTGATFNISTPPPGSVVKVSSMIVVPPIPNGQILTVFNDVSPGVSADTKAQQMADALHSMTITGSGIIQHLIPPTPTPPTPGPPILFNIA